jgi:hypothetical protein
MNLAEAYLCDVREQFRKYKKLAEDAVAQVSDGDLLQTLDNESNSIAIIMRHMAGNLRSRFTDFATSARSCFWRNICATTNGSP